MEYKMADEETSKVVNYFATMHDINRLSHALVQRVYDREGVDVSTEQWKTLGIIYDHGPIAPIEISRKTHKNKGAVARVLTGLEKRELIHRIHGEKQNTYNVDLTEKGHKVLDIAYELGNNVLSEVMANISAQDLDQTIDVLNRTLASITRDQFQ